MLTGNDLQLPDALSEKDFEFTKDELELLYCVQFHAVLADANAKHSIGRISSFFSSDEAKREKELALKTAKQQWLIQWSEITTTLLSVTLRYEGEELQSALNHTITQWSSGKISAFMVEAVTFIPYFPLSKDDKSVKAIKVDEEAFLASLSVLFSNSVKELAVVRSAFKGALNEISKLCKKSSNTLKWVSVSAVVATIVLAPLLAAGIGSLMGLSGAAATSAGLAFLGGGSLVAGGFGMAGGYIVMMAGGAILGRQLGNSLDRAEVAKYSAEELLISCAKLNASLQAAYGRGPSGGRSATISSFCQSARELQAEYEALADLAYLKSDTQEGKAQGKKATILIGFRRYLREL